MAKACIVCLGKATNIINSTLADTLKKHARPNLDTLLKDFRLPKGLCHSCRITLQELDRKGETKRQLRLFDVVKLLPTSRRSDGSSVVSEESINCQCLVCRVVKSKGHLSHELSREITKLAKGRPRVSDTGPEADVCGGCFGEKVKGKTHACNKTSRLDNLQQRLSPRSREQFASRQLKEIVGQGSEASGAGVQLSTGGRKLNVAVGVDSAKRALQFTTEDMSHLQNNLNLSDNQTLKLARGLRSKGGRGIIEPNLRDSMGEVHRSLDTFFDSRVMTFETDRNEDTKTYDKAERPAVVCNDTKGLVQYLMNKRNLDPIITLTKITWDGGKGQFKVCLNLIEDYLVTHSPIKKRSRYADGIQPDRAEQGGVLQSIIIGIFPDIPETYNNIKLIYDTLELGCVEHVASGDFKVLNILSGLQPCSSKHPCCYCTWSSDGKTTQDFPLRTMGMIRTQNQLWESYCESQRQRGKQPDRTKLKSYQNCEHRPVFEDSDDTLILDKCPPPQLHILLGVFNQIFKFMADVWPAANEWPAKLCLEKEAQFGGTFNGNSCRKLLKNLHLLKNLRPPRGAKHYLNILETLNKIVAGCFGSKLSESYKRDIKQFDSEYGLLMDKSGQPLKKTPKVQHLIIHVPQFCQKTGIGLGVFSEQVVESMHSKFDKVWKNFSVPLGHASYGQKLFRATMRLNTSHQ